MLFISLCEASSHKLLTVFVFTDLFCMNVVDSSEETGNRGGIISAKETTVVMPTDTGYLVRYSVQVHCLQP